MASLAHPSSMDFPAHPKWYSSTRHVSVCKQARIAVLLLPGIGTLKELKEAAAQGAQVVRIATQCTEADISQQHFESAREMGLEMVGFLMMAHMRHLSISSCRQS